MATYTVELFRIVESRDGDIGLDDYPIHDESHREVLNKLIMMTYATHEIGSETPDLFIYRLRTKMHQIMPYYNQLYKSELLAFDPITNTRIKTTAKRSAEVAESNDTNVNATGNNTSGSRAVNSTFPQVELSGNGQYATEATDSNGKTESVSNTEQFAQSDSTSAEDSESESLGYQGDPNALLAAHRDNMLNIDMTIVADLRPLFLSVWEVPTGSSSYPNFSPLPNV